MGKKFEKEQRNHGEGEVRESIRETEEAINEVAKDMDEIAKRLEQAQHDLAVERELPESPRNTKHTKELEMHIIEIRGFLERYEEKRAQLTKQQEQFCGLQEKSTRVLEKFESDTEN